MIIIIATSSISYAQGQYVEVNDIKMYYEIHGKGEPLLLLHAGRGGMQDGAGLIAALEGNFQVIAPESRGHHRTSDSNQPITYELMASDMMKLLDHLNLDSVNVAGWSDGGIIGLQLAISHPERIKKLIAISANFSPDGVDESAVANIKNMTPETVFPKLIERYKKLAPEPDHWPIFVEKLKTMWLSLPNFTTDMLANIKTPALVMVGDRDGFVRLDHTIELFQSIPNAQLCVIPGATHSTPRKEPGLLSQTIINFFKNADSQ